MAALTSQKYFHVSRGEKTCGNFHSFQQLHGNSLTVIELMICSYYQENRNLKLKTLNLKSQSYSRSTHGLSPLNLSFDFVQIYNNLKRLKC